MKRFFFTLAAITFTSLLISGTDIQASGPKGSSKSASKVVPKATVHAAEKVHTTHQSSNVRFYARSYRGWNAYCWFPRQGCYGFYDPCCQGWFYWCQPAGQFLPVDSLATNAPTTSGASLLPTGAVPVTTSVTPILPIEPAPMIPPAPSVETPPQIETPPAVNP